ncbi:Golgi transport complex subunit COG4 KNAG_0A07540 [Huiozyma naganishii CBS 8797]|uniref:Conserved oligomeric Golgi complex subunit 4 n=1 Tax=Huiozyma naganishii (strain ATCC MYA-139 / BCRC 22969 / CBS 8797 / KCTC 17520 / NBRC 10181 / NCYC 3082 / Yp74L-3) TaxID=1071383 RepID=J7RUA6_HUIN7|nr:hypothetical protein KNAG_0A07540 [Kazachstania naganishii CBS 8797]CCK68407.1 hypothetical protein KNAG_0A07540 [Kazachstania naganishii CBS 8797]
MPDAETQWDDHLSKNLAKYSLLLDKLTTLSQVTKLQNMVRADHAETAAQLNELVAESHTVHNKQIRRLELRRTGLTSTLSQFHTALNAVRNSNVEARSINTEISTTDAEREFLQQTHSFLNDVRSLKNNISLIQGALKDGDYLVAATAINEINELPSEIVNSQFALATIPTPEMPHSAGEILAQWTDELRTLFKANFTAAVAANNIDDLTFYFKLFPLIGEPTLGLDLYSKFITDIISQENQKFIATALKLDSGFHWVLLQLFKISSTVINEHSKIIERAYGLEYMPFIMTKVEVEVELQSCLVLNYFKETKLDTVAAEVQGTAAKTLINEFSQFLQNWSMYSRFFSVRWREFSAVGEENNETQGPLTLANPITDGSFMRKLHDENIFHTFQDLNLKYLARSSRRSVELEELPDINPLISTTLIPHEDPSSWPISSVLEDVILLLRQSLVCTVNTGQFAILAEFIASVVKFITNDFLVNFVQKRLKRLQEELNNGTIPSLRKYIPHDEETPQERARSPMAKAGSPGYHGPPQTQYQMQQSTGKFNLRGAFANIQSNLQSVVVANELDDQGNDDEINILRLHKYLIYINTLYFFQIATHKLFVEEIVEENARLLPDNFPFNDDCHRIADQLRSAESKISEQTGKLSHWGLRYLFQTALLHRVKRLLNDLFINGTDNNYIANTDDFEDLSQINSFIVKWTNFITPYQNVLYRDAHHALLLLLTDFCKNFVEKRVWALRVNELGAVKLDRELSLFISTICGLNYSLREDFTRVTQIVLLLGFDDDDFDVRTGDIKEELVNSIDWVLSPQDRAQTRSLKVDKRR